MIGMGSYCKASDDSPSPSSSTSCFWADAPLRLRGAGTGVTNLAARRPSMIRLVGCPSSSSSQCRAGSSYGELRMGCSKKSGIAGQRLPIDPYLRRSTTETRPLLPSPRVRQVLESSAKAGRGSSAHATSSAPHHSVIRRCPNESSLMLSRRSHRRPACRHPAVLTHQEPIPSFPSHFSPIANGTQIVYTNRVSPATPPKCPPPNPSCSCRSNAS